MKKAIILALITFWLGSPNGYGQGAPKPIFGAKAGLNLANVTGETDNKLKTAFHAGVYSEVFFDYFLMMQAELLVSLQGHGADKNNAFSSSLDLWYITLPVMARYNLGYNFNVHAGIQPGVLLSANSKYQDQKFDVKDQFKGFDLGLPVGVGYEFWDRKLNVTLRYIIPLTNMSQDAAFTRKNSVFQFSVGFAIMRVDE